MRPEHLSDAWRDWMRTFGGHLTLLRQFFGLTASQVAAEAAVAEGVVRRLEEGRLLELSFIDVIRVNRALAHRLRAVDPAMLSDEVRSFIDHLDYLQLPDEFGPPAPGGVPIDHFGVFEDKRVPQLLTMYFSLSPRQQDAFLDVVRTLANELATPTPQSPTNGR